MKTLSWRPWASTVALAALAIAPCVQAQTVTFESVAPTFLAPSVTSDGFVFTSDAYGFSGVDNATAFSSFGNAPAGAQGNFLYALNGDGIEMRAANGSSFMLDTFSASFLAPMGGMAAGIVPGELYVIGTNAAGGNRPLIDIYVFPASNASGNFAFTTYASLQLKGISLSKVDFFSCVYDAQGTCDFDFPNSSLMAPQFALDNVTVVPEPATLALFAAGIAALVLRRRAAA